jgi:hypothetical protein
MQSVAAHLCSCPSQAGFSWQPSEHASAGGQRRGAALFYLKAWSLLSWGRPAKHKLHLSRPHEEGTALKASVSHVAPWHASSTERGRDHDPERFPDKVMKVATQDAQLLEPFKRHITRKQAHQNRELSAHLCDNMMDENWRGQKDTQDPGENSIGTDAVDGAEVAESLPFGFEHSLQAVPKFGPVELEGDEGRESGCFLILLESCRYCRHYCVRVIFVAISSRAGRIALKVAVSPIPRCISQSVPCSSPPYFLAVLPIMPLSSVKFPTEDVPLQLFEPRYRYGPWLPLPF